MSTRPDECGYCGQDHGSNEPCPALDGETGTRDRIRCAECGLPINDVPENATYDERICDACYLRNDR